MKKDDLIYIIPKNDKPIKIVFEQSLFLNPPNCYKPNNNPYPLCVGNGKDHCKHCFLYEDMEEPELD